MSKASEIEARKQEVISTLRSVGVKPGARVYTSVSHVSSSGMSRRIHCYMVTKDTYTKGSKEHRIQDITGLVAVACGFRRHKDGGMVLSGCGMDMGFQVVYSLGRAMFPKGAPIFVSGIRESQAKQAGKGKEGEKDGGYLLRHERL